MEDKKNNAFFTIAEESRLKEGNLRKAIYYFNKSLENKQQLYKCVKNLVDIYIQTEMYDEAIRLINDNKEDLDIIDFYTPIVK